VVQRYLHRERTAVTTITKRRFSQNLLLAAGSLQRLMPTVRTASPNADSGDTGDRGGYFALDAMAQSIDQEVEISVA